MTGVAVNVTRDPKQDGLAEHTIETLTDRFRLTVIAIWFEIAGFPVAHE